MRGFISLSMHYSLLKTKIVEASLKHAVSLDVSILQHTKEATETFTWQIDANDAAGHYFFRRNTKVRGWSP